MITDTEDHFIIISFKDFFLCFFKSLMMLREGEELDIIFFK